MKLEAIARLEAIAIRLEAIASSLLGWIHPAFSRFRYPASLRKAKGPRSDPDCASWWRRTTGSFSSCGTDTLHSVGFA